MMHKRIIPWLSLTYAQHKKRFRKAIRIENMEYRVIFFSYSAGIETNNKICIRGIFLALFNIQIELLLRKSLFLQKNLPQMFSRVLNEPHHILARNFLYSIKYEKMSYRKTLFLDPFYTVQPVCWKQCFCEKYCGKKPEAHLELVEQLRWNFFAKRVNGFQSITIAAKKLHRRCSSGF